MVTDGIRSAAPNTQPIYPRTPLTWVARLTNQATALDPQTTGTPPLVPPVYLGTASDSGALLEHVAVMSVKWDPGSGGGVSGGGGGGGSWNPADGPVGLRASADPQRLRFYTRKQGGELLMAIEFSLNPDNPFQSLPWGGMPILPQGQAAWRLEPGEELYVGLRYPAPGINLFVRGGHYE